LQREFSRSRTRKVGKEKGSSLAAVADRTWRGEMRNIREECGKVGLSQTEEERKRRQAMREKKKRRCINE